MEQPKEVTPRWEQEPVPGGYSQPCVICKIVDMRPKMWSIPHKGGAHHTCLGKPDVPCIWPPCLERVPPDVMACVKHKGDRPSPTICVICGECGGTEKVFYQSMYEPKRGVAHVKCLEEHTIKMRELANE